MGRVGWGRTSFKCGRKLEGSDDWKKDESRRRRERMRKKAGHKVLYRPCQLKKYIKTDGSMCVCVCARARVCVCACVMSALRAIVMQRLKSSLMFCHHCGWKEAFHPPALHKSAVKRWKRHGPPRSLSLDLLPPLLPDTRDCLPDSRNLIPLMFIIPPD